MSNYEKGLEEDSEYTIDVLVLINELWNGIKKFGWLIIVLSLLTAGISVYRNYKNYSPFYTASATFTVSLSEDAENSNIYDDNMKALQMSKTFPYILTSGLLRNVIAADLGEDYVSESISAENVTDTNLFTLKVTSGDAQRAYEVLQSVIRNYPKISESVVGTTYLSMIDESGIPVEPVNRINYKHSIKTGLIPGAFAGVVVILIFALTRRTIHCVEDLTKLSSMKHLGSLPEVIFKKRSKKQSTTITIKNEKVNSFYKDNIYRIRTRVQKMAESGKMKTIIVTSAIQGEGKSTFAFNLSLALAEGGKNVVLIDCDLRRHSISDMITIQEGAASLDKILNGEADLKDALRFYDDLNISVIANPESVPNASEIIDKPIMYDILTELKKSSDYIILDTAPSAILSDTSELARFADGIIYVVKQDYAKVKDILMGLEHLTECSNTEMIGFVLNGAKAGFGGYGYGYGYGYGHGRYGYHKDKNIEEPIIKEEKA